MYKVTFYFKSTPLAHYIDPQDDILQALYAGRKKLPIVLGALRQQEQYRKTQPHDMELHVDPYDPQYTLFKETANEGLVEQGRR